MTKNKKEKYQRKSTSSLAPVPPNSHHSLSHSQHEWVEVNVELSSRCSLVFSLSNEHSTNERKSKLPARSPSLKRSPSIRFRKSHKPTSSQTTANGQNSPCHVSPRRSFVKSIVKKGLRTLKSSSSLLANQMSGQIYDESSGESLASTTGNTNSTSGMNFSIDLEDCESSSISNSIPIVVEILTRLVELRGIHYQGIYRNAGGLTAVHWLVNELDKGVENVDLNSERWYDTKAVASTLKTFFAKLPDSLLSSSSFS